MDSHRQGNQASQYFQIPWYDYHHAAKLYAHTAIAYHWSWAIRFYPPLASWRSKAGLDMNLDLRSVLAKLGRAYEHTQTVKGEILGWRNSNPYIVTREHNSDFTRHSLVAHLGIKPMAVRWTLMVGDVVHNLRAALDHLVYAIAIFEANGQEPPPKADTLAFPLCDDPDSFTGANGAKRRIASLSDPVRAAIEGCQPYNRRHPELPPLLSVLNTLEKTDKHKLLRLAFSSTAQGDIGFTGPPIEGLSVQFWANPAEIEEGTEILAYTCSRSAPDMKFDRFELFISVTLLHGAGPNGKDRTDAVALLTALNQEVREIIEYVSAAALR